MWLFMMLETDLIQNSLKNTTSKEDISMEEKLKMDLSMFLQVKEFTKDPPLPLGSNLVRLKLILILTKFSNTVETILDLLT